MKVLWFEVTEPSAYVSEGAPIGGWQDSLERIVRTVPEIELTIVFMSTRFSEVKVIDDVRYIPIYFTRSLYECLFRKYWDVYVEKMLPKVKNIIEDSNPDLIQIFGTEWPWGQVATCTDVPVVIHIMGSIVPYSNANYPPGYSYYGQLLHNWWNPKKLLSIWMSKRNHNNWKDWEYKTWKLVSNYMGRTQWDESLSRVLHPGRRYFHVEEALRNDFLSGHYSWQMPTNEKLILLSIGCTTFWKGPDMLLKVAKILTEMGVDFDWFVAGKMDGNVKKEVEEHEQTSFEDVHVTIMGYKQPKELMAMLCSSTMYVHTAYIENSPNSICEAQCLGVPVVSTNVGGISTLVRQDIDGILVSANDPWQMADAIVELSKDKKRMLRYSENGKAFALARHDDAHIKQQLLECYYTILREKIKA